MLGPQGAVRFLETPQGCPSLPGAVSAHSSECPPGGRAGRRELSPTTHSSRVSERTDLSPPGCRDAGLTGIVTPLRLAAESRARASGRTACLPAGSSSRYSLERDRAGPLRRAGGDSPLLARLGLSSLGDYPRSGLPGSKTVPSGAPDGRAVREISPLSTGRLSAGRIQSDRTTSQLLKVEIRTRDFSADRITSLRVSDLVIVHHQTPLLVITVATTDG